MTWIAFALGLVVGIVQGAFGWRMWRRVHQRREDEAQRRISTEISQERRLNHLEHDLMRLEEQVVRLNVTMWGKDTP